MKTMISLLLGAALGMGIWYVIDYTPEGGLGGCISLGLAKRMTHASATNSYCFQDKTAYYCLVREDK